jgi:hypothetical protein
VALERQSGADGFGHHGAERGGLGLHEGRVGGDQDGLEGQTDGHLNVEADVAIKAEEDVLAGRGPKTRRVHGQGVDARGQELEQVVAAAVGGGGAFEAGLAVAEAGLGGGDDDAGRVGDGALQRGAKFLGHGQAWQQGQDNRCGWIWSRMALHWKTMTRPWTCSAVLLLASWAPAARSEVVPDPHRGLYAIWTRTGAADHLPFIKGGQVRVQWAAVEPAQGHYDFSGLHLQLEKVAGLGRVTTVQLNANQLPGWIFTKVPHSKEQLGNAQDRRGTIQYWHPAYVKAYTDLIAAFAREVKSSAYHSRVIGVRLSYNAIGTEWMLIPPQERDPARWIAPDGVEPGPAWTEEIATAYRRTVIDAYVRNFGPDIRVFLRTGFPKYPDPDQDSLRLADKGEGNLGFFTTASSMEPNAPYMAKRYQVVFRPYCRPGKMVCYAESVEFPGGNHAQWNYWRLLSDLDLGFSMIGIYETDLAHSADPEFRAAFDFAARYAGYHASPSVSPGAWVALREGNQLLKGDYTFLMRRLGGTEMKPERKIGPAEQRFGAWALTLPKGAEVKFALDADFARSLKKATVRVTYLDRGAGAFTLRAAGQDFQGKLTGTGGWKTVQFETRQPPADLAIAADSDLTLHMVEVAR